MAQEEFIVSVMPSKDEVTGTYTVNVVVTGLTTEEQASAVSDYIIKTFCSEEIIPS